MWNISPSIIFNNTTIYDSNRFYVYSFQTKQTGLDFMRKKFTKFSFFFFLAKKVVKFFRFSFQYLLKRNVIFHKIEKSFFCFVREMRCPEICNKIRELVDRVKRETVALISKLHKNTTFLKMQLKNSRKVFKIWSDEIGG